MQASPEQEKVIIVGTVVLLATALIVGLFLLVKRAPESELGDIELFSSTSTDPASEEGSTQILYTAGQFGQPGDVNLWKTSGDFFTIRVPHEWEINQRDAQGMSSVVFFDPARPEHVGEVTLQSASEFATGERVAYDAWFSEQLTVLGETEPCVAVDFGDLSMTCFTGGLEQREQIFLAELNDELFVMIRKPLETEKITPLWEVMRTIDFTPSPSNVENALVIP